MGWLSVGPRRRACSLGTVPASEMTVPASRRSTRVSFNLPVDVLGSFYI